MILRTVLPLMAVVGLLLGIIFTFSYGRGEAPPPNRLAQPPATPFDNTVSGTGITEANTRNIEVGSFLSGIVAQLWVTEGDTVEAGAALFQLDDRAARSEVEMRTREIAAASSRLEQARIQVADEQDQLKRYESMEAGTAISKDKLMRQRFSTQRAVTAVTTADAELASAKAQLESAKVTLEQLTVRAPVAGRILKVRIRPGEFVTAGSGDAPILIGNDQPLYLRVSIDENDVWRFDPNAKATAALRSNKDITVPLHFVRIEPYVLPKRNLSGEILERVDTRVLEVLYAIDKSDTPLYIGQQMDVFIEAKK